MKAHIHLFILIIIITTSNNVYTQADFTKHIIDDQFDFIASLHPIDIDGDGKTDLVGSGNSGVAWWRNDGGYPILWTKFFVDQSFENSLSVYPIDVDNDNDVDIVAASWTGNEVAWWRNDGGDPIIWTKQTIDNTCTNAHDVYACDLDKDGDTDILGAWAGSNQVAWWRNDGGFPLVWTKQIISNNFGGARSVHAADMDSDGDNDVVGAAAMDNKVSCWRNDGGDPIQWTEFVLSNTFNWAHRVNICDIDLDGNNDILAAAYQSNEIVWWQNNGSDFTTWTKQKISEYFVGAMLANAADIDCDGDMDVVGTASIADDIAWWENSGGSPIQWIRHDIDINFDGAWPAYIYDINSDGNLDIFAGADQADDVVLFENITLHNNFSADTTSGYLPFTVHFSDESTPSSRITSWSWDFNDDGIIDSYDQNPSWTYTEPGVFSVMLIVSDGITSDTLIKQDYIEVQRRLVQIEIPYTPGWNLLSSPVDVLSTLSFPHLFDYAGRYRSRDSLEQGRGYWAKPESNYTYTGYQIFSDSIEVTRRWNIIGTISEPVPVTQIGSIPPNIITSYFYEYDRDSGYRISDTLKPGKGYWVKVNEPGKLILSVSPVPPPSPNRIIIISDGELPPQPPKPLTTNTTFNGLKLHQNYPNPFNSSTQINYSVPNSMPVKLILYNLLGEKMMVLVIEVKEAGYYSLSVNFDNLPAGIYYYKIIADNAVKVNKLLYIK